MIKRWAFYCVLTAFVSHNVVFVFKMLAGHQPTVNVTCPFAISLFNTPLLFDRDELFFNTQIYTLTYADQSVPLTRRDIRQGLFSYFDMLYFAHWGKYNQMEGANQAIFTHFFCHENSFMKKLELSPPTAVERQIFDSRNQLVLGEKIECRK